ncbi:pantetheine-phosphate adenylyltransferase [Slackia equolifaciens]|uniref:Phosphopantetheine adenylyltransferase n=1 Tax=Slackia equolifaciens TaxID=498718 RepID=A0A3N0B1N4_9ACTN|nr:pantetheine-phosphate adenylyltransferase [Slackia equolifaciens]RNL41053.1 pantetheine-phosphate adenylyltransferase [Slackia equolifaciens]HJF65251.1 pantetheine-phosphate adenylyltransferase [Slackia equolifaciens]
MKKALVPGTFDPITNGHLDVITRASQIFDEVVVGVAASVGKGPKGPLFSLEERVQFARDATAHLDNVTVMCFNDLLVHFAEQIGANVVVKGLRAITDFEYEFQMTAANYRLNKNIETMFIMSPPEYMYLSSSIVREISSFDGNVSDLVPDGVEKALKQRFRDKL